MALEVLASDSLSFTPNEMKQFERIRKRMVNKYETEGSRYCVVVDRVIGRHQYDMIVMKNDSVISLDLKGYRGRVVGSENGPWHVEQPDGRTIEIEQGMNPFLEAKGQRYQLMSFLNRKLSDISFRFKKHPIRNISSVVCFEDNSSYDIDQMDHRAVPWFYVTNESNLLDCIEIASSHEFFLKDIEMDALLKTMNLRRLDTGEGTKEIGASRKPIRRKSIWEPNIVYDSLLKEGDTYPGSYSGRQFGFDFRGVLFRKLGAKRIPIYGAGDDLWEVFRKHKPEGGTLRVNEHGHVMVKVAKREGFRTIYLGHVREFPLTFSRD